MLLAWSVCGVCGQCVVVLVSAQWFLVSAQWIVDCDQCAVVVVSAQWFLVSVQWGWSVFGCCGIILWGMGMISSQG